MERGDNSRTLLLDEPMLRLAGDVAGLKVCDVGCGEGRFCRMLAERGAEVTGVEPTARLIDEARRKHPEGTYLEGVGERLPVESDSFDLVVCYLVLIDIAGYRAAINEMVRVAKPGGRILIANLNSFVTTRTNAWTRDEDGKELYVAVDNYFDERGQVISWSGIEIVNFHRPFEVYMSALLAAGLRLTHFEEPRPAPDVAEKNPSVADGLRVPFFHVMQWRKE